jgi:hypothetical protein
MKNSDRLRRLISIANPQVGVIADLAMWVLDWPSHKNKEVTEWIENRGIELLEKLIAESRKEDPSQPLLRELEIRLHETLDILMDLKKWDGGQK